MDANVVTSIRNETPSRLTLKGAEGQSLTLAPLEERGFEDASAFDLEALERDGIVRLGKDAPQGLAELIMLVLFGGGFWVVLICWAVTSWVDPPGTLTAAAWSRTVWLSGLGILLLAVGVVVIRGTNSASLVARFTTQIAALAVILAIGFGMPAATIWFFGDGRALLAAADTSPLALFGRLVQLAFIATASLLPVLLFFLFDRFQLGTLRRRLYANLFRLDRTVRTTGAINAKYGSQIAEAYGPEDEARGRLAPGSRWPVLVCAFVVTLGWIVALAPVGQFAPKTATEALAVLLPQPTAFAFGFLGVYFFSLRMIALRYARGDLKPKAYSQIMVRILIVAVLSWVLDAIFEGDSKAMLLLAFLFGYLPDEFFTWARETYRGRLPMNIFPEPTRIPLNDLEGIDIYDRGRLEGEGVVNVESLAHHELIDLVIETRIPVPRLVDWVDQAILYLHLSGGTDAGAGKKLRDYGIRTASDLLRAWRQAGERSAGELETFKKLLGGADKPYRLEVIRDALTDDEWIHTVLCWRDDAPNDPIEVEALPASAEALERWADHQFELHRYDAALDALGRALRLHDTAGVRLKVARILATSPVPGQRDPARAREHARRALELEPPDHAIVSGLAEVYLAIDDYDDARRMCAAAAEMVEGWPNERLAKEEKERLQALSERIDQAEKERQHAPDALVYEAKRTTETGG